MTNEVTLIMTAGVLQRLSLLCFCYSHRAFVGLYRRKHQHLFCERAMEQISADAEPITVTFGKSGKIIAWNRN